VEQNVNRRRNLKQDQPQPSNRPNRLNSSRRRELETFDLSSPLARRCLPSSRRLPLRPVGVDARLGVSMLLTDLEGLFRSPLLLDDVEPGRDRRYQPPE
jgi:hypothetical protein